MSPRAVLGKQPCVLDGHSQLASGGLHDLEIPVLELQFPFRAQRRHHSHRLAAINIGTRKTTVPALPV